MQPQDLSDNALRLWSAYFLTPGNTLRFGGDHAEMAITPEAREALEELLAAGAAQLIPADDQWPGREHYGATDLDLRAICIERGGGTSELAFKWLTETEFVTFRKKHPA